ncbi:DHA2 family efflux MFS transporter permease subunit [Staphylococcus hyicus]|uniref:MDR family MFS transporter n=1 Tax=Staphylococcus hyicus TaxID=1284 RepID=UPI0014310641|nr:MDR family MFS transporter [Staphylococcus hyicus]NJI00498.1 DHA2 family efflux MFS transporter permease subunit [Staphylococcus hyicus]NJI30959.1 DHA2 family efflux MFS transporter permease subunit [Staphylococcus hyicus]
MENNHSRIIMIVFLIGAFFMILNETLLNIALQELMNYFDISRTTVQWMASGFMMIMGIVSPLSALIIQWFSTRRLFLGLIAIFTIGSLIAGTAMNFPLLLTGRMVQAIGTGLMIPLIMNAMLLLFDESVRGKVMGTFGFVIMFAPALGPTLSGFIVDYLGWRWLFFSVVPFMLFTFIFAVIFLKNVGEVTRPNIDVWSVVLSTLGITAVIFSVSKMGATEGALLNPIIFIPLIVGLICVVCFIRRQYLLEEPILDFRVLQYHNYTKGMIIFVIVIMTMFASEIVMPMYLQGPMGFSAKIAGLILLPGAILNGILSPFMGELFDKYGPRKLVVPGLMLLLAVAGFYTTIHPGLSVLTFVFAYIILMIGIAAIMMPASTNGLNALPKEKYPHGTAIFNVLQPVAGAIGIAIFVGIVTGVQNVKVAGQSNVTKAIKDEAMTSGMHIAYYFALVLLVMAIIIAWTLTNASKERKNSNLTAKKS